MGWARKIIIALILIVLIGLPLAAGILGDFYWFESIGYQQVYLTILLNSIWIWLLFFSVMFIFLTINWKLAKRISAPKGRAKKAKEGAGREGMFWILAFLFSIIVAFGATNWEVVLKFLNPTAFGQVDPIFGLDIGFYVFILPLYS